MITTNPNQRGSGLPLPAGATPSPLSQHNSGGLKAVPPPVVDLHAEISTLKSARETDAYLLSLREREIAELRNLLQAKVSGDFSITPSSQQHQQHQQIKQAGLHSLNNDSTETLVFGDNGREARDLDPLITDVTKICDSPVLQQQNSKLSTNESRLLSSMHYEPQTGDFLGCGGVEMKRSGGIRFGSMDPNYEDQNETQPGSDFTEKELQSFRSLAIHNRTFVGSTDVLLNETGASRPVELLQLQGMHDKSSPLFQPGSLEVRGLSPGIKSGPTTRCSSTSELPSNGNNIWGQYPAYNLSSSLKTSGSLQTEMYRQTSLQQRGSRHDFHSEDPRTMNRAFADQETTSRYKSQKFSLDPTSPAYVPSNAGSFRPQNRVQSVPSFGGRDSDKSVWGTCNSSSSRQGSSQYPEFDDMIGDSSLYPATENDFSPSLGRAYSSRDSGRDSVYNQAQLLQNAYLADGLLLAGDDVDDYGSLTGEYNEFGDSIHYQLLVEKIIQTNDQPASLHLQQNIKHLSGLIQNPVTEANTVTAAIRSRNQLMEAVRPQALSLMRNRFGNFLMQRCLEFGTRDQVKGIVSLMVGHVYPLSCDRFGCHVVQKALDVCEDDIKFNFVSELFSAIPETITHRFACHVWQRVFETKWGTPLAPQSATALEQFPLTANMVDTTSPAQVQITFSNRSKIVQRVDTALKGLWHLVANDENGSLVVQCVFENCADSDKREIVKEVLLFAADIAKGQWGNWVIQHLLDHGTPGDKSHIFKVVARHVYSMSVDQFASKVVEKVLKSCQRRELYDIVDVIISPVMRENGCPGILEMMNNQYANYVVQHILTLSDPAQRDSCVRLIAPHLPVLRGSKYGQRVAAIVEKHIRTCQQRFGTIINASNANTIQSLNHFTNSASNPTTVNEEDRYNNSQNGGYVNQNGVYNFSTPPTNPLFNNTYAAASGNINPFDATNQNLYQQQPNQQQQQAQIYATSPNFRESSLMAGHVMANQHLQQQQLKLG
ncbi:UNVERIFIED_CONTAM: hypothetical protein HDU68_008931 [Siphonaria sp. JEL0065]|nr:hypothetical protein HDU68_008931 [Siphonaria sp. JEL0065]